jgi:DNA-binding transcriptional ArsR family regulator
MQDLTAILLLIVYGMPERFKLFAAGPDLSKEISYIPFREYSFSGIFLSWYNQVMEAILSALAESNRLKIIELLRDGPRSVGEIATELGLRQPQVSKHLRVLSDAGLVEVHPIANRRIYKLRPQPLKELDDWLESFRRVWDERFDQLDDYLREVQAKEKKEGCGKQS